MTSLLSYAPYLFCISLNELYEPTFYAQLSKLFGYDHNILIIDPENITTHSSFI